MGIEGSGTFARASEINSLERENFSWSEEEGIMSRGVVLLTDDWDWQLQSTKIFETDTTIHKMYSYILDSQTSDYRWCKAYTIHTAKSGGTDLGYSRARFETVFGTVVD